MRAYRLALCVLPAAALAAPEKEESGWEKRVAALEREIESLKKEVATAKPGANAFNPRLTVFGDFIGRFNPGGKYKDQAGQDRFSLRETEIDARASVDPYARGVLILSVREESPGAFETEPEECYVESTSLPMTLKAGKFRMSAGSANLLHTHDLPTFDRPLVHTRFFGDEGLAGTGLHASSWLPTPEAFPLEAAVELVNGDNATAFSGSTSEDPAPLAHLKWFRDLTDAATLELGSTYTVGMHNAPFNDTQKLFGVDAAWKWQPKVATLYRSFLVQAEWWQGDREVVTRLDNDGNGITDERIEGKNARPEGWYFLAQTQLGRRWYAGARYDDAESLNDVRDRERVVGAHVSFYTTEFLRLRFGVEQHGLNGHRDDYLAYLFGLTWVFGAHPAEPYWVSR